MPAFDAEQGCERLFIA